MDSIVDHFTRLIDTLHRDVEIARSMDTPNLVDTLAIKAAMVGFSYHTSLTDWDEKLFEFVRTRIDSEYPPEELAHYGSNAENIALFFALCLGYLLGAYRQDDIDDIDDNEFRIAEHQIPGIIMLHLEKLTSHNLVSGR